MATKFARDANYHDILFDPTDSRPDYIGGNTLNGATTTASDWEIYKIYYDTTSSNITRIRLTSGIWNNRAALFP